MLKCGPCDVTLFCSLGISKLWYLSCGLCWSVVPMMLLCSVCRVYQGFDIWAVVCVEVWSLWCYCVLFVGYIKALISGLWSVLKCGPYDFTLLFVGYIKALISELWSVLECGPYDVTLFKPKSWPVDPIERSAHKVTKFSVLKINVVKMYSISWLRFDADSPLYSPTLPSKT